MAAAHHAAPDSRYAHLPPPAAYDNRRLPSLKDLNFPYRRLPPLGQENGAEAATHAPPVSASSSSAENSSQPQGHSNRHPEQWRRANGQTSISPAALHHHQHQEQPQQQHTPPLSAGHDQAAHKMVEYQSRHDTNGYLTPGVPLSAQMGTTATTRSGEDLSHLHPHKRSRTGSSSSSSVDVPRDTRPPPPPPSYPHYPPYMAAAPPPPPSQYSAMPPPPQPPSPYTAVHPPAPRMHYSYQQPYVPHHMGYPPQEHWEHPHASVSSHPPPMSSHAPPTSSHPPPTSSHPPPTSSHPPPTSSHAPPMSSHLPPASSHPQPAPPSQSPVTHQAVHHAPTPTHQQHPQPHPHSHPPPPSHHSTSSSLHPPPPHHTHHSSSSSLHPAPSHHAHHSTTPHHPVHQAPPAHHTPVSHHSQVQQHPQSQQHHSVAPHRTPTTHHTPPTSHHVHHASAPHQPPQSPYQPVPNHISAPIPTPAPVAVPPSSLHHHPPHTPHHTQQIHHHVPPPSNHVVHHHQAPPHQQAPPPPQPQSQPHQPQPQQAFPRTTALIPTELDTRNSYPPPVTNNGDALVREIVEQCSILYHFASRWSQMAQSPVQPSPTELADMMNRANRVVRLLEDLRRQVYPEGERARSSASSVRDDHRPPKRPWEDMSKENGVTDQTENSSYPDNYKPQPDPMSVSAHPVQPIQSQPQQAPETPVTASTAEQDMELIRSKRAATTNAGVNGTPGQTKNKYRKRSRANPPGKCHSCNIRETPEWRRGPDGARTLCNACGLHYAKLMRKQERHHGANAPGIDMETLRASARAADQDKVRAAANKQAAKRKAEVGDASPDQKPTAQPLPAQSHHQGSFQVMPPPGTQHPPPPQPAQPPPPQQQMTPQSQPAVPPPPWAANGRAYAPEQMPSSSQSFLRTPSHPSQSTSAR